MNILRQDRPNPDDPGDDMMRLLTRVVTGEATEVEVAQIESWMAESPHRESAVGDLRAAARSMEQLPSRYLSANAWQRVARSTGIRSGPVRELAPACMQSPAVSSHQSADRVRASIRGRVLRGAAAAVLVIALPLVLNQMRHRAAGTHVTPGGPLVVETGTGGVRQVVLPDGSRVTLGPESRLEYARGSDGGREVDLHGRAFFDVAHEDNVPFVVHAEGITTRVLGTRFMVRAYPGDRQVRVAVERGKVAVDGPPGGSTPGVVLGPGDIADMGGTPEPTVVRGATSRSDFGWASGLLSFDQAPLPEVIAELERWYGAHIELGDPSLASRRLTVTLHRGALTEVLQPIALTLGVRVEQRGDTFVLLPQTGTPDDGHPGRDPPN